jgi:hypothetical protein
MTCSWRENLKMNHGLGVQYLVDAIDRGNRNASLNDDLIAAEMAAAQNRVGLWTRVIGRIRTAFSAIGTNRAKRPETLEESVERLARVSPHLLDDIGLTAAGHLPVLEDVPAGRGLVRTQLSDAKGAAPKSAAAATTPACHVGHTGGHPFGNIAPAE